MPAVIRSVWLSDGGARQVLSSSGVSTPVSVSDQAGAPKQRRSDPLRLLENFPFLHLRE